MCRSNRQRYYALVMRSPMKNSVIVAPLLCMTGCASVQRDNAYRDIVRYQSQPVTVGDPVSFRLAEKWRVASTGLRERGLSRGAVSPQTPSLGSQVSRASRARQTRQCGIGVVR